MFRLPLPSVLTLVWCLLCFQIQGEICLLGSYKAHVIIGLEDRAVEDVGNIAFNGDMLIHPFDCISKFYWNKSSERLS